MGLHKLTDISAHFRCLHNQGRRTGRLFRHSYPRRPCPACAHAKRRCGKASWKYLNKQIKCTMGETKKQRRSWCIESPCHVSCIAGTREWRSGSDYCKFTALSDEASHLRRGLTDCSLYVRGTCSAKRANGKMRAVCGISSPQVQPPALQAMMWFPA